MFRSVKTLIRIAGATALVSLAGCSSLGSSLLPAGLVDALGGVTGLSSAVGEFAGSLGSSLDAAGLGQLRDFASQAGDLGGTIDGFTSQVSAAAADPLQAISGKLVDMSGLNVDALRNLPGAQQIEAVNGFADSASGVGAAASSFLQQFGG